MILARFWVGFIFAWTAGTLVLPAFATEYSDPIDPTLEVYNDPGLGPWEVVAREDQISLCGLDPGILAEIDSEIGYSYAIVRYGRLCHEHYEPPDGEDPEPAQLGEVRENFSATKTLAAVTVGRAVRMSAELPSPLSDQDRVDAWVDNSTVHPDARVIDVLAMVADSRSLAFGERTFSYDAYGIIQVNHLSRVVNWVVIQDPAHFGNVQTTGDFAARHVFAPLGMTESTWPGVSFAASWRSSLRDMARLGLVLVHRGVWNQRRFLDPEWVDKMTHPVYEDTNTGYGYMTWLAASSHHYVPGVESRIDVPLGSCIPKAIWPDYPRENSEAADCGYLPQYSCDQAFDAGVFGAAGYGGQVIVGHRGLDLVLVAKDAGDGTFYTGTWKTIRPALIAHDPVYAGDEEAFCAAYGAGSYAPDLIRVPEPSSPLAMVAALSALSLLYRRREPSRTRSPFSGRVDQAAPGGIE